MSELPWGLPFWLVHVLYDRRPMALSADSVLLRPQQILGLRKLSSYAFQALIGGLDIFWLCQMSKQLCLHRH